MYLITELMILTDHNFFIMILLGSFTLMYRGYETAAIDYGASNTQMKARLEALPNINTVNVVRAGPNPQLEYSWTITFESMPGTFPDGTGTVDLLTSSTNTGGSGNGGGSNNQLTLLGTGSIVYINQTATSSPSLQGTFTLTMTTGNISSWCFSTLIFLFM